MPDANSSFNSSSLVLYRLKTDASCSERDKPSSGVTIKKYSFVPLSGVKDDTDMGIIKPSEYLITYYLTNSIDSIYLLNSEPVIVYLRGNCYANQDSCNFSLDCTTYQICRKDVKSK